MSASVPTETTSPIIKNRSSKFNSEFIETDPKKVITQLIKDISFEKRYDEKTNKAVITYTLPLWLTRNYSNDTVIEFIKVITPIIQEEISKSDDVKPLPEESYITGL